MRGMYVCIALAHLVSSASLASGEEITYDLRGPAPSKGQVYCSTMSFKIVDADTTLKIGAEKPITMKLTMRHTSEKEHRVLVVDGRRITRCQSKIIKDRSEILFEGSLKPTAEESVLEGEVVLSELVDEDQWKHSLVDTKPSDRQKMELENRIGIESGDDLYPAEKVKVGHTWTIPAKSLSKLFDKSFVDIDGELKQRFVRVEEFGGEECAIVESNGAVKCKMKDDEGKPTTDVEMDLTVIAWRSLQSGIELKEILEGKITLSGPQNVNGETVKVTLSGPFKGTTITKIKS